MILQLIIQLVYFPDITFGHHGHANSKASSSGSRARKWSSLTSPQVENDQIMYLAFSSPPHPYTRRHTPWIPDLPFSCFPCTLQEQKRQGRKAQSWARPHLVAGFPISSSSFLSNMTWRPLGWPRKDSCDLCRSSRSNCAAILTPFPQQYCVGPSYLFNGHEYPKFSKSFLPKQMRSSKRAGNTSDPFLPFIIASTVLSK